MVCRPGSHRLLAREGRRGHPHVAGVGLDGLPPRDYGEPTPILARAGQVSVVTTGMVHGSSVNVDDEPRRALIMTYTARGVRIDLRMAPSRSTRTDIAKPSRVRRRSDGTSIPRSVSACGGMAPRSPGPMKEPTIGTLYAALSILGSGRVLRKLHPKIAVRSHHPFWCKAVCRVSFRSGAAIWRARPLVGRCSRGV